MRILREDTAAVIIDIQERLFPHIAENEDLSMRTEILISGLKILRVPVLYTEQYPKGLGATIQEIGSLMEENEALEKIAFSCCDDTGFINRLDELNKRFIILAGIEAHVCVLQTCIDLLALDRLPVVIEDCISSRNLDDKHTAIERMRQEGAIISSSESVLFELCRVSGTEEFKNISKLVK